MYDNKQQMTKSNYNLPEFEEFTKMYPLNPLPFYSQISQPLQSLPTFNVKKIEKPRVSFKQKIDKKQIPVVKITVPNPRRLGNESQTQALYRQLKQSVEEITNLKKLLESQKQKSEFMVIELNRKIEKLVFERDTLKEEIRRHRQEQNKNRPFKEGNIQTLENKISKLMSEVQFYKDKFSKEEKLKMTQQLQIRNLRMVVQEKQNKFNEYSQTTAKKQKSGNSQYMSKLQKQVQNLKSQLLYKNILLDKAQKEKGEALLHQRTQSQTQNKCQIYQKHLQLSVKQIKTIEHFIKQITKQMGEKVNFLKLQLTVANQKYDNLKSQLDKVYEILQGKKKQLQQCYKNVSHSHVKQSPSKYEESQFQSLLKERRDYI